MTTPTLAQALRGSLAKANEHGRDLAQRERFRTVAQDLDRAAADFARTVELAEARWLAGVR